MNGKKQVLFIEQILSLEMVRNEKKYGPSNGLCQCNAMYHNILYILLYFHPGTHFSFMTTQAHQRVLSFNWILYRIYSLDENFHIDNMKCKVPTWATFVEGSDGLSMF